MRCAAWSPSCGPRRWTSSAPRPALRALIDRTAATAGLEIELDVDLAYEQGRADTRHAPELESTMYRLVQEALTNVVKHAGASRVTVAVIEDDTTVELTVTDDGAGFQTDAASEGFGLIGMRERIALLGGELDFNSAARRRHHRRRADPGPAAPARTARTNTAIPRRPPLGLTLRRPDAAVGGRPQQAHQPVEVAVLGPIAARARRDVRAPRTARDPPCP